MIKTFYYRDEKIINHKAKHYKAFDADIQYNSIWVTKIHDDKFLDFKDKIYNFNYLRSGGYNRISVGVRLNTHIDPIIKGKTERGFRTFVYLTWCQYYKIKWSHKQTEIQRNLIQFLLLLFTAIGITVGSIISYLSYQEQKQPIKPIKVHILKSKQPRIIYHKINSLKFQKDSVNK